MCVKLWPLVLGTFCPEVPASSPVVLSSSSWLTVKQASCVHGDGKEKGLKEIL